MAIRIDNRIPAPFMAGVVEVEGIQLAGASEQLRVECAELVEHIRAAGLNAEGGSAYLSEGQRGAARRMLKGGGFSPTGRNRPAHELLLNMISEQDAFPHINNVVDINNLISLRLLLPISLLDAARIGEFATLRWGQDGESYVFNQSGHAIELKRCLVIAGAEGEPLGSPIKDSMAGKVFDGCTALLGVIYASTEIMAPSELEGRLQEFAGLLLREAGGSLVQLSVDAGAG